MQRYYIEQLRAGLKALPAGEQQEIVQEIESHIAEALAAGRSLADVLERLGPADRLARAFTADAILRSGSRPLRELIKAAMLMAATSLASLIIVPLLAFFGLLFPFTGVMAAIGNTLYLITGHKVPPFGITTMSLPGEPKWVQLLGIGLSVAIFLLGLGALALLRRYVRFAIRTVRGSLQ